MAYDLIVRGGTIVDGSGLPVAAVLAVSAETGAGIDALKAEIGRVPARAVSQGRGFRLAVDRCFVLDGVG